MKSADERHKQAMRMGTMVIGFLLLSLFTALGLAQGAQTYILAEKEGDLGEYTVTTDQMPTFIPLQDPEIPVGANVTISVKDGGEFSLRIYGKDGPGSDTLFFTVTGEYSFSVLFAGKVTMDFGRTGEFFRAEFVGVVPLVLGSEILGCRGSNRLLSGGAAGNRIYSNIRLTNFNDIGTIRIDNMLVYGNDGSLLCNFPAEDQFPDRFKSTLGPHETTSITTLSMTQVGCLPEADFPSSGSNATSVSILIYWSFADDGGKIPLDAYHSDISQDLNTGTLWNHMGRSTTECRDLPELKKTK